MKNGDRVLVRTPWSEQGSIQRFHITKLSSTAVFGKWETGELEGKEARIDRARFDIEEVLS